MIPSIALPYKKMDNAQQIEFAKNLIFKMSSDTRFSSLLPNVQELAIKLNEWQVAIKEARFGGKIKTIKKIEKGLTVMDKIFFLASKVEIMAEHNQVVIAAAGFENKRKRIKLSNDAFTPVQIEELLLAMA